MAEIKVTGASTSVLSEVMTAEIARLHDQGVRTDTDELLYLIAETHRRA